MPRKSVRRTFLVVAALLTTAIPWTLWHRHVGRAQDPTMSGKINLPLPTLGGAQLWTDLAIRDGFRVQQHAITGHYRLLDPENVRRAWGSRDDVMPELNRRSPARTDASDGPTVVLIHGLLRTARSMQPMEEALRAAGYRHTLRFGYASGRASLSQSAAALRRVLEDQPEDTTFCIVGHSMGNIVVRHLVGDLNRDGDPQNLLPRIEAMVMLGPPNQGAAIARNLAATGVFEALVGPGGMQLGENFEQIQSQLATPPFPFLIIAGDVSEKTPANPLTPQAGDLVVSLQETRLEGAEDWIKVPRMHTFLMEDAEVQAATLDFLKRHAASAL